MSYGPVCYPHPAELSKQERMKTESELKGVSLEDHPGKRWWLCGRCGVWHKHEEIK